MSKDQDRVGAVLVRLQLDPDLRAIAAARTMMRVRQANLAEPTNDLEDQTGNQEHRRERASEKH